MNQNGIKGQRKISKYFGIFCCPCKEEISLQNMDSYTILEFGSDQLVSGNNKI